MKRPILAILATIAALMTSLIPPIPSSAASDPGYTFFFLRANGEPLGYHNCHPHAVLINPANGTPAMVRAIRRALPQISQQTGHQFYFAGLTNLAWDGPMAPGEQFATAPIRIGFSTAKRTRQLAGRTAGWTSVSQLSRAGRMELGRIRMVLDSGDYRAMTKRRVRMRGPAGKGSVPYAKWFQQSLVPHEFGHVLGLSHTSNTRQLMSPRVTATGFQPGDLAGIARLNRGSCHR